MKYGRDIGWVGIHIYLMRKLWEGGGRGDVN